MSQKSRAVPTCAVGNMEAAESRFEIMEELAPDHPDTIEVFPYLLKARLEHGTVRMKEEQMPGYKNETVQAGPKAGRNDPCPCGSGKKYKKCCMKNEN